MSDFPKTPRIVFVGAGFVGLFAARLLAHRLGDRADVVLIDAKDHFLFTPRLIDALADNRVDVSRYTINLRTQGSNADFSFTQGVVTAIDRTTRMIVLSSGERVSYDILVLGQGSKTSYYGIPGAEENSLALKTDADIDRVAKRINELLERERHLEDTDAKKKLLSFVVIGGGASGVEAIFALKRRVHAAILATDPELITLLSFTLIQAAPQILPGFPHKIVEGVLQECDKHGILVRVGERVVSVTSDAIKTAEGTMIPTGLTLWAAGITPNKISITPEIDLDPAGCIVTDQFLQIEPRIFAAGDVVTYKEQNVTIPKNAQTAMLMARLIAKNIARTLVRQPLTPFHYASKGNLLTLDATGFIDTGFFSFKSRLTPLVRDMFYRYRQWQIRH